MLTESKSLQRESFWPQLANTQIFNKSPEKWMNLQENQNHSTIASTSQLKTTLITSAESATKKETSRIHSTTTSLLQVLKMENPSSRQ